MLQRITETGRWLADAGLRTGHTLLDMLYPLKCPVCRQILPAQAPDYTICPACRSTLPYVRQPLCVKCGKPIGDAGAEYCRDCEKGRHVFRQGRSTFVYEGRLREAVVRMKFHNQRIYVPFFAGEMVRQNRAFIRSVGQVQLLPVPMHPRKRRERGFDQCLLLAREIALLTGMTLCDDALVRTRYTLPQKGLSRQEREDNLRQAFAVENTGSLGKRVLIIDDIYTTGSTIDAVSRSLLKAGVEETYALTLCIGADAEGPGNK